MPTYNQTPTGRGLARLDVAIDALNTLHRETTEIFPAHAEIHMDDLADHVTAIRAKLTRAKLALERVAEIEPAAREAVPARPARRTESMA